MPVVRKASIANRVTVKREIGTISAAGSRNVRLQRAAADVQDLGDVDLPAGLGSGQDGHVLIYDSASDKFKLVDPDIVLSASVDDNDLPDDFITQLEDEIDLGNVQLDEVDGGGFV